MNILDIVLCAVLGFLTIRGIFRGLVKEIASLLGLVLGFLTANSLYEEVAPLLSTLFSENLAHLIAYLGIFFIVVGAIFLAAVLIRKILDLILLGWVDTLGGGALGLFKGALLCSIVVLALTSFLPPRSEILTTSRVVPYITSFSVLLAEAVPKDMRSKFLARTKELRLEWEARILQKLQELPREDTNDRD